MDEAKIKVTVRQSSGDQFEVEISAKAAVKDLKEECAKKQEAMAAGEMRLIFKGKILKDEMTLDEYKITDGMTIHLVKGKAAGGQPSAPTSTAASDSGASASANNAGAGAAGAGIGLAGSGAQPNPFAGGFGGPGGMGGFGGGMPPGMGMGGMQPGQMPSAD